MSSIVIHPPYPYVHNTQKDIELELLNGTSMRFKLKAFSSNKLESKRLKGLMTEN